MGTLGSEGWDHDAEGSKLWSWVLAVAVAVFAAYLFVGLKVVADEYLSPSLDAMSLALKVPSSVSAATFVAFGSSAPELVISAIGSATNTTETTIPTLLASALIAFGFIPALVLFSARSDHDSRGGESRGFSSRRTAKKSDSDDSDDGDAVVSLDPVSQLRDAFAYLVALAVLFAYSFRKRTNLVESLFLVALYFAYLGVVYAVHQETEGDAAAAALNVAEPPRASRYDGDDNVRVSEDTRTFQREDESEPLKEAVVGRPVVVAFAAPEPSSSSSSYTALRPRRDGDADSDADAASVVARHRAEEDDEDDEDDDDDDEELALSSRAFADHRARREEARAPDNERSALLGAARRRDNNNNNTNAGEEEEEEEDTTCLCFSCGASSSTSTALSRRLSRTREALESPYRVACSATIVGGPIPRFAITLAWIALLSYGAVAAADAIVLLTDVSAATAGVTLLAVGAQVPDCIAAAELARNGQADSALAQAVGSQVINLTLGLGLPFAVTCLAYDSVIVTSNNDTVRNISVLLCGTLLIYVGVLVVGLGRGEPQGRRRQRRHSKDQQHKPLLSSSEEIQSSLRALFFGDDAAFPSRQRRRRDDDDDVNAALVPPERVSPPKLPPLRTTVSRATAWLFLAAFAAIYVLAVVSAELGRPRWAGPNWAASTA